MKISEQCLERFNKNKTNFVRQFITRNVLAKGKLRDLHYELLEHPPYSPYMAPSNFYLFPKLFLAGQRFSSNQEAIAGVEGYFGDLTKNHYRDGIMALEHRWNKCISLKGYYVEK
jgi:histone-lysine N-methyltransferase SETMAR